MIFKELIIWIEDKKVIECDRGFDFLLVILLNNKNGDKRFVDDSLFCIDFYV